MSGGILPSHGDVGGTGLLGSGGNELGSGPHAVGPLGTNRPDCHVAGELLNASLGVRVAHVPYKGGPDAIQAVLKGDDVYPKPSDACPLNARG